MPDTTETNRFSDWFAKHRNGAADIELGHKLSQAVMAAGMTEVADEVGTRTGLTPICVTAIPAATVARH